MPKKVEISELELIAHEVPTKVNVGGIPVELTYEQRCHICRVKMDIASAAYDGEKSLVKALEKVGFRLEDKKQKTYFHTYHDWFAQIMDRGNYYDVFMVGPGLKTSSFPGGWVYSEPSEILEEINRFYAEN